MQKSLIPAEEWQLDLTVDARYYRQGLEITLNVSDGWYLPGELGSLVATYASAHERLYGFSLPAPIEVVSVRLTASAGGLAAHTEAGKTPSEIPPPVPIDANHMAFFKKTWVTTPLFDRAELVSGAVVDGPAIVIETDSTTLIHPGCRARMDDAGSLLIAPIRVNGG
jgi:N-methylhydantoinase A